MSVSVLTVAAALGVGSGYGRIEGAEPPADTAAVTKPPATESATERPLAKELAEFTAGYEARATPEQRARLARAMEETKETGVLARAKRVGDRAPEFELIDASGSAVKLSTLLARGPVVLTWHRGVWCPFCNMQLKAMQARLSEFEAAGATVVAISPQMPDSSAAMVKKNGLTLVVLSDISNRPAEAYGVGFVMPESIAPKTGRGGGGANWLAKFNGDETNTLPLSAT